MSPAFLKAIYETIAKTGIDACVMCLVVMIQYFWYQEGDIKARKYNEI